MGSGGRSSDSPLLFAEAFVSDVKYTQPPDGLHTFILEETEIFPAIVIKFCIQTAAYRLSKRLDK